jgi:hypothetical protein
VQPCQDFAPAGESLNPQSESEQARLQDGGEGDRQEDTHECSPFCICSCRQVSTSYNLTVLSMAEEVTAVAAASPAVFYQNNYSNQYLSSIWQPPKFTFTV